MIFFLGFMFGVYCSLLLGIVYMTVEVERAVKRAQKRADRLREDLEATQAEALRWWEDWERR